MTENITVFVSSTFEDLKAHRKAVIGALHDIDISAPGRMERPATTAADTLAHSLKELEKCNVYLCILGVRYGEIPSNETLSTTHCEYRRALELHEKGQIIEIKVYLADWDALQFPPSAIEQGEGAEKLKAFRKELEKKHTCEYFTSAGELAIKVTADFSNFNKMLSSREQRPDVQRTTKLTPFSANEEVFKEIFDKSVDPYLDKIEKFLQIVATQLNKLFVIQPHDLNVHPFFQELRQSLEDIVPGINFDHINGKLFRAGVRHVVLRSDTLIELMETILFGLQEKKLFEVGNTIGEKAAADLVNHTIHVKKMLPRTSKDFIELWNYWDRTGGWGKLTLEFDKSPEATWVIKIENSFLTDERKSKSFAERKRNTERLAKFWEGYIQGFLNASLEQISNEMNAQLEDEELRQEISWPEYQKVKKVERIKEGDDKVTVDYFNVHFQPEKLSPAIRKVVQSGELLKKGKHHASLRASWEALRLTQQIIEEPIEKWPIFFEYGHTIEEMDKREEVPESMASQEKAEKWWNAIRIAVIQLRQNK